MTNIIKEKIEKEIFNLLDNGGDREFLRYRINNIDGKGLNKEFIDFKNTTHTINNAKDTCPGMTVNVHHNTNSILDDPFFGYGSPIAALFIAIIVTVIAPARDVRVVIFLVMEMVMVTEQSAS